MDFKRDYAMLARLTRRNEQMLWVCGLYFDMMQVVVDTRAWYRGETNAAVPTQFVSTIMRAGDDGQQRLRHRLLSLARAMNQGDTLQTEAYQQLRLVSYEVLEVLAGMNDFAELSVAKLELDAIFEYVERMAKRKVEDVRFQDRIMEMMEKFLTIWERLTESIAKLERQLLGQEIGDVELRRVERQGEEIGRGIATLLRRERTTVSARTQQFVLKSVEYYQRHPEACIGDVSRRRVYLVDVWNTVEKQAKEEYHIRDGKEFCRIYESARRSQRRARNKQGKSAVREI